MRCLHSVAAGVISNLAELHGQAAIAGAAQGALEIPCMDAELAGRAGLADVRHENNWLAATGQRGRASRLHARIQVIITSQEAPHAASCMLVLSTALGVAASATMREAVKHA